MADEKTYKDCPHCGQEVLARAIKCKHCKSSIEEDSAASNSDENTEVQSGKGFLGSLFDTSMREMITPKIIRFVFIIGLIGYAFAALVYIISMLITGDILAVVFAIVAAPIGFFIAVLFLRIYLEIIIILFRIYDELKISNRNA